mgnify:CR=1 FL=1
MSMNIHEWIYKYNKKNNIMIYIFTDFNIDFVSSLHFLTNVSIGSINDLSDLILFSNNRLIILLRYLNVVLRCLSLVPVMISILVPS